MSIGDNIRKLREHHGLSQVELGRIAGVSDKAVSTWENGLKVPRMGAVERICDYFGLQRSDILNDEPALVNADAELTEYLEMLRTRPECRMLFSVTRNATKEDVEKAVAIIEALRKTEGRD